MIKGSVKVDVSPMEGLRKTLVSKVLKKATTEAGKVVQTALKGQGDSWGKTGGFSKAIGIKVKTWSQTKTAMAIVGPKVRWFKVVGVRSRGKNKGEQIIYRPSKITHIIERGSSRSKPKHPLKSALDSSLGQYLEVLNNAIARNVELVLSKSAS